MSIYNKFWLTRIENLAQNASIEEYYLQFNALRGLVEYTDPFIPESHYNSLFINGFVTEVHAYVEGFFPSTIVNAYSLACIFVNGYSRCFPLSHVVVTEAQEVDIEPVESNFVSLLEDAEHPDDVGDYTVMVQDISVPFTVQHNDIGRLMKEASTAIMVSSFSPTSIDSRSIGHSFSVDVDISYDMGENQESANGCAIKNFTQAKWGFSKFCFDPGIFLLYPDLVYSSNHGLVEDNMCEVIYRSGIAQGSIILSDICIDTRVFPCFLCVNASDSSTIRDEFFGSCLSLCFTVEAKPVVECDYVPEQVVSYTIAANLNDINLEEHEEVPIPHIDVLVTVLAQEDKGGTVLHMPTFLATVSSVSHKLAAPMDCWVIVWLTPTFVKHFGFHLVGILHQLLFLLMCSATMLEALALVFLLIQDIFSVDYLLVLVIPWIGYIPRSGCYYQVMCIFIWSNTCLYQPDDGFYSHIVVQMHWITLLLPFRLLLLQWTYPKCLLIAVLKCSLSRPQESSQVLHAALATGIVRCNISWGVYGSRTLVTIPKTFEKLAFQSSHVFWQLMARRIKLRPIKVNGHVQGTKFYIADDVLIMLGLSCYANFLDMPSQEGAPSSYALIILPPLMVLQGMVELQECYVDYNFCI